MLAMVGSFRVRGYKVNPVLNVKRVLVSSCLIVFLIGLVTGIIGYAKTAPAANLVYIYNTDTTTANDFATFLTSWGYPTTLLSMSGVSSFDFSGYGLIIIGWDTSTTYSPEQWGDSNDSGSMIANVLGSEKPIIGLGEGGSLFFDMIGLTNLGYGQSWWGSNSGIYVMDPSNPIFTSPIPIPIPNPPDLILYNNNYTDFGVYLPSPPTDITVLGMEITDTTETHYALVAQGTSYFHWGFSGVGPSAMTPVGRALFTNTIAYMTGAVPSRPVTLNFSGVQQSVSEWIPGSGGAPPTSVPPAQQQFAPQFLNVEAVLVSLTYDANQLDTNPDPNTGTYSAGTLSVQIPQIGLSASRSSTNMQISTFLNVGTPPNDQFFAYVNGVDTFVNRVGLPNPTSFDALFFGDTSMLANDSLPTSPLNWTSGNVSFNFTASDGSTRQVLMNIIPAPPPPPTCTVSLGTTSASYKASGGAGSFTYEFLNCSSCPTITASDPTWITFPSPATCDLQNGTGQVFFLVAPNGASARPGTITVNNQTFTITEDSLLPKAYPAGGTYSSSVNVGLLGDSGTTIFYSTDGSTPTTGSSQYASPIPISGSQTTLNFFEAYPLGGGMWNMGTVRTEFYTIQPSLSASIAPLPAQVWSGGSIPVTATFTNNTGSPIMTMNPDLDCIGNIFFEVIDSNGNPLLPRCRIRTAYGIPADVGTIKAGSSFTANCYLSDMYDPSFLVPGSYTVQGFFSSYIQDPNIVNGQCTAPNNQCYNLWTGAIASAPVRLTLAADTTPPVTTLTFGPGPRNPKLPPASIVASGSLVSTNGTLSFSVSCFDTPGLVANFSATDDLSGVQQINYTLAPVSSKTGGQTGSGAFVSNSGSLALGTVGLTNLTYYSTDRAGNSESPHTELISVGPLFSCGSTLIPKTSIPAHAKVSISGTLTINGKTTPFSISYTY